MVKSVPNGNQTGRTILSANGGPRSYSHDGLRNVLEDLEREAGNAAWTEPAGYFNRWASLAAAAVAAAAADGAETADQRRGDVLSVNPRTAERIVTTSSAPTTHPTSDAARRTHSKSRSRKQPLRKRTK